MIDERLTFITSELQNMKFQLIDILVYKKSGINLSHRSIRDLIFNFVNVTPKPTIKDKVSINHTIRNNIRNFIIDYIEPTVKNVLQKNDPYIFIEVISEIWANFQRFVFAHHLVADKLNQFFQTFYKMSNAKDFSAKGQVLQVVVIAVNQLKTYFQKTQILLIFPRYFTFFIMKQRQGELIPRQMLKQTVKAIQSVHFDFDAIIKLDSNNRPYICKNPRQSQNSQRRSKDGDYFKIYIMNTVLQDCQQFYTNFVRQKCLRLSATQQIELMTQILQSQEQRSSFYILSLDNRRKYISKVQQLLIGTNMIQRINKETGLIKFLREFHPMISQFYTQIKKFWKVYSRILDQSLPLIVKIYDSYLIEQAILVQQKIDKFMEHISELIYINVKNIKIISLLGNNFELQNKRNQKIRGMLSNQIVKQSKFKGKHTMGASNLAQFINLKFKQIYFKGIQGSKQTICSMQSLFKILQQKMYFTKQHQKLTSQRLLQDLDFSKDIQTHTIISLQKCFIQQMQKQMGISQVKQLLQNIKDVQKSIDFCKVMKDKFGYDFHLMNQIIVKTSTFWPDKANYQIVPPNCLFKIANQVEAYFNKTSSNVQFQYHNGVSLFRGQFQSKVPKQNFQLKNIYMIILLLLDQAPDKKLFYADIKFRIKSYGTKKQKGNLELAKNIIELLHIGLIISSTKKLSREDTKCFKILQSDQFQLNRHFDYQQQLKENKVPLKMIKRLTVIKTSTIQMLPKQFKKMFILQSNELAQDQINWQKQRRIRVKQITIKTLKHAHHSNKNCSFAQLFTQYNVAKYLQFRVSQKYLKEILQQLINDQYCQRLQGQRNIFKYKA